MSQCDQFYFLGSIIQRDKNLNEDIFHGTRVG
uniref:Uncharacterized protein n=1 Tax=Rhizophora mucronata TaxID=61149 RepID=A0A2P2NLC4_RHIMU